MELKKGICFSCGVTNVISEPPKKKIERILFSLFPDKIFNINALKKCACLLKLCPICLHKLILLKEANEEIQPINNKASNVGINFCLMCGKDCLTFKISHAWNHFNKISEDFPLLSGAREIVLCSGCIFYLDTRNTVKIKLCSEYPQLKKVPKLKLNLEEVTKHPSPEDTRKRQINVRNTVPIDIASESGESKLDWSPLKGFRALKYEKLLKKSRLISRDSKFMNQILYVRINKNNIFQDKNEKVDRINSVGPESRMELSQNDQSKPSSLENSYFNLESDCTETQSEKHTNNNTSINSSRIRNNSSKYETRQELFREKNNAFFKIRLKKNKKPIKKNKKQYVHYEKKLHSNEMNCNKKLVVNIERHIDVDQKVFQSFDEDNVLKKDDISTTNIDIENVNIETSMESLVLENESIASPQEIINETFENNEHTINGLGYEQFEEKGRESFPYNIDETELSSQNPDRTIKAPSNVNFEEEIEYKKDIMSKKTIHEGTVSAEKESDSEKTSFENDSMKDEYTEENTKPENDFTTVQYNEEDLNEPLNNAKSNDNCSVDDHFNEKSPGQPVERKDDKFDDRTESKKESQDAEGDKLDKIDLGNNEDQHMNDTDVSDKSGKNENFEFNNENHEQDEMDCGLKEKDNDNTQLDLEDTDEKDSNEKSVERNNSQELPGDSNIEYDDASKQYNKRKRIDSPEDSNSPDKKKKKVTFSDAVLESPR